VGIVLAFPSGIINLDEDEQPHTEQYQQPKKDIEVCHLFISATAAVTPLQFFAAFLSQPRLLFGAASFYLLPVSEARVQPNLA